MQNFIKELSNSIEKELKNSNEKIKNNYVCYNLLSDNLQIDNKKITTKYKNKLLIERADILQNYAQETKDKGEMYYIYNTDENVFHLCNCNSKKSHDVIVKNKEELPDNSTLGSVLRMQNEEFILDNESSQIIAKQINDAIQEKIKEQDNYLDRKRIEGHIYEVDEKVSGRVWLYDLSNISDTGSEEFEEIEFPENLYDTAKSGDYFIYKNGNYEKYDSGW